MNPLISIIIPTYNRAHIIGETLDSIIAQTYTNWECIIVDDGSTDDTEELINTYKRKDSRFKFYKRPIERVKGVSSSRNIGIEKAIGHYILFLDSDDLLAPFCLDIRFKVAYENKLFDFYIFNTQLFSENIENLGKIFNIPFDIYSDENYLDSFLKDNYPFCVMSVLWVSEKLKTTGGFDVNLQVLEDPELHIRALSIGLKSYTDNNSLPDTFYRKSSIVSPRNLEFELKHIMSKYFFYKKYLPIFKVQMGKHPLTFFRVNVLGAGGIVEFWRYYFLYFKNDLFTSKQLLLVPLLLFYKLFKLHRIKGLGFYKLSKCILQ